MRESVSLLPKPRGSDLSYELSGDARIKDAKIKQENRRRWKHRGQRQEERKTEEAKGKRQGEKFSSPTYQTQ